MNDSKNFCAVCGCAIPGMHTTLCPTVNPTGAVWAAGQVSIAHEAAQQVEQRREVYGDPSPNFERIAAFWNVYIGAKLAQAAQHQGNVAAFRFTLVDVATMMRLVKEARLIETPDHRDSLVDIAGYADCQWECVKK